MQRELVLLVMIVLPFSGCNKLAAPQETEQALTGTWNGISPCDQNQREPGDPPPSQLPFAGKNNRCEESVYGGASGEGGVLANGYAKCGPQGSGSAGSGS